MRKLMITVEFPEECAELLEHPEGLCLVLPMTSDEVVHLGNVINGIGRHLEFTLKLLRAMKEIAESKPASIGQIREMLDKLIEPAEGANEIFDGIRVLLGRAVISKNGKGGRVQ